MTTTSTDARRATIRPARTAADVDAVLRGRHRVYTEEFDYFGRTPDRRIYDRFDTYPGTTVHLLAEVHGCVVGGVRYCIHHPRLGLPVDEFFDFAPHLRPGDRVACGGMMFVSRAAAGAGIAARLIRHGEACARRWAASVMVGTVNPAIEGLFGRLDYVAVGRAQDHASGLAFVPVIKRLAAEGIR